MRFHLDLVGSASLGHTDDLLQDALHSYMGLLRDIAHMLNQEVQQQ
ncbi:MAG: hypothetical protein OXE59_05240 [Bacteroidetes bacterium]|nr:hypothetical protein [Bacteroidota bacterium]